MKRNGERKRYHSSFLLLRVNCLANFIIVQKKKTCFFTWLVGSLLSCAASASRAGAVSAGGGERPAFLQSGHSFVIFPCVVRWREKQWMSVSVAKCCFREKKLAWQRHVQKCTANAVKQERWFGRSPKGYFTLVAMTRLPRSAAPEFLQVCPPCEKNERRAKKCQVFQFEVMQRSLSRSRHIGRFSSCDGLCWLHSPGWLDSKSCECREGNKLFSPVVCKLLCAFIFVFLFFYFHYK